MAPFPKVECGVMGALVSASFLLLTLADRTGGVVDYCNDHTFVTDTSYLQFTKEISTKEYALAGKFKALHCCAKGYRSIEWFKDGAPYPWSSSASNLILYPESANQTVYAQTASTTDTGNYSCVVRNDSHIIRHSVVLHVFEPEVDEVGYTGPPRATYEPRDQFAARGQPARFFCEAFVGRVDLPDAKSEVRWWRSIPSTPSFTGVGGELNAIALEDGVGGGGGGGGGGGDWVLATESAVGGEVTDVPTVTLQDSGSRHHHHHHLYHRSKHHVKPKPRFHQEVVPREDNQILGAYLLIREVQNEDYGEYCCSVRNAGGENTLRMSSWLRERGEEEAQEVEKEMLKPPAPDNSCVIYTIVGALCGMLVFMAMMLMMAWKTNIYLLVKNFCKKRENGDGKEYGICVFYEDKGKTFTSGTNLETSKCMTLSSIMPTFDPNHGYHCFTQPPPNTDHLPLTEGEKGGDDCARVR